MVRISSRYEKLYRSLKEKELDAILLTKRANQRYLEGFTGADCFLLAAPAGNTLLADSRYTELAKSECRTAEIRAHRPPNPLLPEVLSSLAAELGIKRIGFEAENMVYSLHAELTAKTGCEFIPTTAMVEKIRAVKESQEVAHISAAAGVADRALAELLPFIVPGVSEADLVTELEYSMRRAGAEEAAFETIILFGSRASQPHATPRKDVRLAPGDFVLIDFGATVNGYRSDTTRTFVCGIASGEQRHAYETVLRSQQAAVAAIAPGVNGRELNRIALDIITEAGFPAFEYGLGHGVGLEVHEQPGLRQKADSLLAQGMILTIEPGIYKPGWGGIRIEDTLLVTEDSSCSLSSFPRHLMELHAAY